MRGPATRAIDGLAQIGRYLGIGIANMIAVISPDRVVIGGGIGAGRRTCSSSRSGRSPAAGEDDGLDRVELVPAELGTWAGDRRGHPRRRGRGAGADR